MMPEGLVIFFFFNIEDVKWSSGCT